jgi:DNA polymerase-1
LFKQLGFRSLTAEFASDMVAWRSSETAWKRRWLPLRSRRADYEPILNREDLRAAALAATAAGRIAVDTETNSTDPMRAKLVGISLSWAQHQGVYIP